MKNLTGYQQAHNAVTRNSASNQKLWATADEQQQQIAIVREEIQQFETRAAAGFATPPANEEGEQQLNVLLTNLRTAEARCNTLIQQQVQTYKQIEASTQTYVESITAVQDTLAAPTAAQTSTGAAGSGR